MAMTRTANTTTATEDLIAKLQAKFRWVSPLLANKTKGLYRAVWRNPAAAEYPYLV